MEKTAWGKITLNVAEAGTDENMPSSLDSLGIVEEDSFSLETEEGEKIQLFGSGHVLVDEKQLENIETLSCQVIVPSLEQITKFWDVTKTGSGDTEKYTVHSTVANKHYAVQFLPELEGAIKLEAPKTNPVCKLSFEEKKGWLLAISFSLISVKTTAGKSVKFYLSKKSSSDN